MLLKPPPAQVQVKPRQIDGADVLAWLRSHWREAVVALLVVVGLGYAAVPAIWGPVVAVEPAVRAEFVQTVVASGHVEAPYRVNIASQITGVVSAVPVEEGQSVKAGDVLITLDDRELQSGVVQASGAVAQAEARMRQLRELTLPSAEEALKQAKATLLNAQQAYDRAKHLADTGSGTRASLDDAVKSLDIAKAGLRNAEFQVFTNRPGGSDYVMAETQLRQAMAAAEVAQSRSSYTVIKAPRDGVLISRAVEKGNVVQPSNVLMALSPFVETQLVVQIDEKNLGYLAVGQRALASADAYPKEIFAAEVVYINPGVDLQKASVEVKLKVPNPPPYLRQDMTISVDIETARHAGAVVVPAAAVRQANGDRPWVLKIDGRKAVRQGVKVGLVSGGKAEILDGLKEGALVVPSASATVKPGDRVRARTAAAKAKSS